MNNAMSIKVLLVALALLIGVVIGLLAGVLSRIEGAQLATAVRRGGVAFGGSVTLAVVILTAVGAL